MNEPRSVMLQLPWPHFARNVGGIYKITDRVSSRFYVGSAVDFAKRWNYHLYRLQKNTHPNPIIQSIWNADNSRLSCEIIETIDDRSKENLLRVEQLHLNNSFKLGSLCMNVLRIAGSHQGAKRSKETLEKMSAAQLGHPVTESAKQKMRLAKIGTKLAESHRRKIALGNKGKPGPVHSQESIDRWRRLDRESVRRIRSLHSEGVGTPRIAKQIGCGRATVRRILAGTSYREIV